MNGVRLKKEGRSIGGEKWEINHLAGRNE